MREDVEDPVSNHRREVGIKCEDDLSGVAFQVLLLPCDHRLIGQNREK